MAADVALRSLPTLAGARGAALTENDENELDLVLRCANRAGAPQVQWRGITIVLRAGKHSAHSAQAAPAQGVNPNPQQSARRARTARAGKTAPSKSPNSRQRRSARRLLNFRQARKDREEARGLIDPLPAAPASEWVAASCSNTAPPAAMDPELDVAMSDSLAVAVHTPALNKRPLPLCLPSTYGQGIQKGKVDPRPRLDSNSRLGSRASGRSCPLGDSPPAQTSRSRSRSRLRSPRRSPRLFGQTEARAAAQPEQ
jgi:hypothetical protein